MTAKSDEERSDPLDEFPAKVQCPSSNLEVDVTLTTELLEQQTIASPREFDCD